MAGRARGRSARSTAGVRPLVPRYTSPGWRPDAGGWSPGSELVGGGAIPLGGGTGWLVGGCGAGAGPGGGSEWGAALSDGSPEKCFAGYLGGRTLIAFATCPCTTWSRRKRTSVPAPSACDSRSEEHTSELQSPCNLVCRLLLEKKKK